MISPIPSASAPVPCAGDLRDIEEWISERPLAVGGVEGKFSKQARHKPVLVGVARRDERAIVDVVRLRTFR